MTLTELLVRHEGLRLKVYDDANGREIIPGYQVIGHPTIGIGRALDVNGVTKQEAMQLLWGDLSKIQCEINAAFPWFVDLSEPRKDVIRSMIYNMGMVGFLGFEKMIAAIQAKDFKLAADEMRSSHWASQVKQRAVELASIMQNDDYAGIA